MWVQRWALTMVESIISNKSRSGSCSGPNTCCQISFFDQGRKRWKTEFQKQWKIQIRKRHLGDGFPIEDLKDLYPKMPSLPKAVGLCHFLNDFSIYINGLYRMISNDYPFSWKNYLQLILIFSGTTFLTGRQPAIFSFMPKRIIQT